MLSCTLFDFHFAWQKVGYSQKMSAAFSLAEDCSSSAIFLMLCNKELKKPGDWDFSGPFWFVFHSF